MVLLWMRVKILVCVGIAGGQPHLSAFEQRCPGLPEDSDAALVPEPDRPNKRICAKEVHGVDVRLGLNEDAKDVLCSRRMISGTQGDMHCRQPQHPLTSTSGALKALRYLVCFHYPAFARASCDNHSKPYPPPCPPGLQPCTRYAYRSRSSSETGLA